MEFPFGHHRHHRREDEDHKPMYPPPGTRSFSPPHHPHYHAHHDTTHHDMHGDIHNHPHYPPPGSRSFSPPHVEHTHHGLHPHHHDRPHEPPFLLRPPNVQHVAHESHLPFPHPHHHPHPSHDHPHDRPWPEHHVTLPMGEEVRVFCEAETDYSLSIRDGSVVLTRRNPHDQFQHWIKDEKYCTKVKDEEGFPSFALVNKATGQALQHAMGETQPVRLTPYRVDAFDQSIFWTMSKDVGRGFRTIRMVNNIRLNMDAFHGDKNHGGVHDGTTVVLWEWKKGDNQRWKLVPY